MCFCNIVCDRKWLLVPLSNHEQINKGGQYERKDKRRKGMAPQADHRPKQRRMQRLPKELLKLSLPSRSRERMAATGSQTWQVWTN